MRKTILALALLLLAPLAAKAQVYPAPPNVGLAANRPVPCVSSNPGQPQEPQWYFATDTSVLSICTVTGNPGTWGQTNGGGGGGGVGGSGTPGSFTEWLNSNTLTNAPMLDLSGVTESVNPTAINGAVMFPCTNSASGTTNGLLVSLDSSGNCITLPNGQTGLIEGVMFSGGGTSGTGFEAKLGPTAITFDNQSVINDYVVAGANGEAHDAGATYPTGVQVIGVVKSANAGSGTQATVEISILNTLNPQGPTGHVIQVNTVTTAGATDNLSNTTPAAQTNNQNLVFQTDNGTPVSNVSVEVPLATTGQAGLVKIASDLCGSYTAIIVCGLQGNALTVSGLVASQVICATSTTTFGNCYLGVGIRTVSGNTGTGIVSTDRMGSVRYTASSGATTDTLPQAGSTGFTANFTFLVTNAQGSGSVTITPTTSTINGASTLVVAAGNYCFLYSDNTNYFANCGTTSGGSSGVTSVTGTAPISSSGGTTPAISCPGCVTESTGGAVPTSAHVLGTSSAPNLQAATRGDIDAISYAAGGGSANAQTVTLSPAVAALASGLKVCWKPTAANSTTTPTLAVNGLAATTLIKVGGAALAANDLTTTAIACAIYDGTNFELQNPQTAPTGSGITSINTSATGPAVSIVGGGSTNVTTSGNTVTVSGVNGPPAPTVNLIAATSYTIQNSDNAWRDVFSGGTVAVTLPQANQISVAPFVATRYNNILSSCTACTTSSFSQNSGDTLIMSVSGTPASAITSVSATVAGTTYTLQPSPGFNWDGSTNRSLWMYTATNVPAGTGTVTVNFSSSSSPDIRIVEYTTGPFDHTAQGTQLTGTPPNASATIPITNTADVVVAVTSIFNFSATGCQTGYTSRINNGDGAFCEAVINSSSATFQVPPAEAPPNTVVMAGFSVTGIPTFTTGWYVLLENAGTGLVTVTPTTSTIGGQTTLVLVPNETCEVMSDGTNYNVSWCSTKPNVQTNGVMGQKVEIAGVNTSATNTDVSTTTLIGTGATNAFYEADAEINCTTTTSSATETLTLTYTDTSNTTQTSTAQVVCTTLGSASIASIKLPFRAKASTNIQYGTAHTTAQATYDVSVAIYQLATK